MSRFVLFDTGPLGQIARKRPPEALIAWAERLTTAGVRLAIPEICDYELRREYIRAGLKDSLMVLDLLPTVYDYLPIDTATMQRAAELWASVRIKGKPTADLKELDGDVILNAQARLLIEDGHDVTVASANVGHLSLLVPATHWSEILR